MGRNSGIIKCSEVETQENCELTGVGIRRKLTFGRDRSKEETSKAAVKTDRSWQKLGFGSVHAFKENL